MTWPADIPVLTAALLDGELGPAEHETNTRLLYSVPKVLGVNPQGTFADLVARLDAIDAKLALHGATGLVNLRVINDATSPNSKLVITADALGIAGTVVQGLSVTCDITVAGKNGLDTGTEANSTWYSAYAGLRPDTGELCGLLSTSATAPTTTHASIDGLFTQFRRVARVYNDSSGNFRKFRKDDGWVRYEMGDLTTHAANAGATDGADNTALNCALWYPPGVRLARLQCSVVAQTEGSIYLYVRRKGTPADTYTTVLWSPDATDLIAEVFGRIDVGLDASQEFEWKADVTPNVDIEAGVKIGPLGYYDPS